MLRRRCRCQPLGRLHPQQARMPVKVIRSVASTPLNGQKHLQANFKHFQRGEQGHTRGDAHPAPKTPRCRRLSRYDRRAVHHEPYESRSRSVRASVVQYARRCDYANLCRRAHSNRMAHAVHLSNSLRTTVLNVSVHQCCNRCKRAFAGGKAGSARKQLSSLAIQRERKVCGVSRLVQSNCAPRESVWHQR